MSIRDIAGLVPTISELTLTDIEHAVPLARVLCGGGLRVLEISVRTPAAIACIEAIRKGVPDAIVGAGALTRAVDFAAADRAGAQFGSTPGLTPDLAAASRGARTAVLQAFGALYPDLLFCPTGAITREAARDYLACPNVVCVGGSWMAPAAMQGAGDWQGIEALARDAVSLR
jgi:2-dehydro-3-deoxyphosphogluconate aldolase / (4S)-4-hydroxy-2-oxoglutarate aldolase